jgi:hypothetical protein
MNEACSQHVPLDFNRAVNYSLSIMTNLSTIPVKQLKRAIAIRERIDKLQSKLADVLGEAGEAPVATTGGRRRMSAAARARISAAQKARWARQKGENNSAAASAPAIRRKMSPAARAKIAAAARARWAKAKAANRNSLAAA